MIGLSIGIGFTRFVGDSAPPNPITGTGPVLAALTDGDALSSAVTWGSYTPPVRASAARASVSALMHRNRHASICFASG